MNGRCETCDIEEQCGYKYKPCDCAGYRKFTPKKAEPQTNQPATSEEFTRSAFSDKTWCKYVAGIIGGYLSLPDSKVEGVARIIERRLWALPAPPKIEQAPQSATTSIAPHAAPARAGD